MDVSDSIKETPYKFLDYYRLEDRDIFFGRETETRILLADVIVARLVVLFAQTGTGKTSLINAGVRPLLEDQGFKTFFVRVKKDPIESARREILGLSPADGSESNGTGRATSDSKLTWDGESFAEQVENIANQLRKPIVLFFDQFEEFFIYPIEEELSSHPQTKELQKLEREQQLLRKQQFVKNIATLYHNPKSRVHIVFSMREEWFVEMDMFRDEIPRIYHNDSNLRLLWFDENQAREAIKRPAEEYQVTISDDTVDQLIADIGVNGRIEPARVQIVCDTLWASTKGDHITLDDYLKLGSADGTALPGETTVAKRILYRRLEKEFDKIESLDHLYLFYALLPKLRTPNNTKYVRDLKTLVEKLTNDDPDLREIVIDEAERQELIEQLKQNGKPMLLELCDVLEKKLGLVRVGFRDGDEVIELAHDYLVESLDDLQKRIKAIPPRRLLDDWLGSSEHAGQPLPIDDFDKISRNVDVLKFTPAQAKAMFRSALAHGLYTQLWFDLADPVDREELLKQKINDIEETSHVIDLLATMQTPNAFSLLESILGNEEISSYAVEVLSLKESVPVVRFLAKALAYPNLQPQARKALARFERSRKHLDVADSARQVLQEFEEAERKQSKSAMSSVDSGPLAGPPSVQYHEFHNTVETTSLEPHFRILIKAMTEGRVIPFIGAGANLFVRSPGSPWGIGKFLPSGRELSRMLADRFEYPSLNPHDAADISRVTQYVTAVAGRGALYQELQAVFNADYPISMLHRFMAQLPGLLREKGYFPKGQIILTTNYDDVLERAFEQEQEPFELLTYSSEEQRSGMFVHRPPNGKPRLIENPNEYHELRSTDRTVIIKLAGSVDRSNYDTETFVITEDDYIEQLITDVSSLLPVTLVARLRRSYFLFLGHSLRSWDVRVILRRLWGDQRLNFKSWSIQFNPQRIDQELWQNRGVDILNVPLDEYVEALRQHINGLAEVMT